MSRILLIGSGPLPGSGVRRMGFPSLRTAQFASALVEAGHDVRIGLLLADDADADASLTWRGPKAVGLEAVDGVRTDREGTLDRLHAVRREFQPDAIVTAGPFLPMALGAAVAEDEPLWVDVPGDPMAEAQARAAADDDDAVLDRWHEVYTAALRRGDAFSAVSGVQRAALLGALGTAGRLVGDTLGRRLVEVIPAGVAASSWVQADSVALEGATVLLAGGWNTWLDHETLAAGLIAALTLRPFTVVVTGGGIPGHHEAAYERFRATVLASPHADRFRFEGWVSVERMAGLHDVADVAVCVDRDCIEAELGGRTRLLEARRRGMHVAATAVCEAVRALRGTPGFTELPLGDGDGVARGVLAALDVGRVPLEAPDESAFTTPLIRWAATPRRIPAGRDLAAAAADERSALRTELEAVYATPTWRLLSRLQGVVKRT